MVSKISFGTTNSSGAFSEMIKRPQSYAQQEQPAAASSLSSGKKKHSAGKKILGVLLAGTGIAAALAYAAKSGKFVVAEDATGFMNTVKRGINTAGNYILSAVKNIVPAKEQAAEAAQNVVEAVV